MAKETNSLQTERDGRLFAIDLLKRAARVSLDSACVYPFPFPIEHESDRVPYRRGSQWDGFQKALFRLFREGTEAAQLGFCAVLTEHVSDSGSSGANCQQLLKLEKAGLLQPWGTKAKDFPVLEKIKTEEDWAKEQARAVIAIAKHKAIADEHQSRRRQ